MYVPYKVCTCTGIIFSHKTFKYLYMSKLQKPVIPAQDFQSGILDLLYIYQVFLSFALDMVITKTKLWS